MEVKGQLHQRPLVLSTFRSISGPRFCWTGPWNCLGVELLLIPKVLTHHWQGSVGSDIVRVTAPVFPQNCDLKKTLKNQIKVVTVDKRCLERNCVSSSSPERAGLWRAAGLRGQGPASASAPGHHGRHCPLVAAAAPAAEGREGVSPWDHISSGKKLDGRVFSFQPPPSMP